MVGTHLSLQLLMAPVTIKTFSGKEFVQLCGMHQEQLVEAAAITVSAPIMVCLMGYTLVLIVFIEGAVVDNNNC